MVERDATISGVIDGLGQCFDPDEVELATWGRFTLTWTGCDTVTFEYDSVVPGRYFPAGRAWSRRQCNP